MLTPEVNKEVSNNHAMEHQGSYRQDLNRQPVQSYVLSTQPCSFNLSASPAFNHYETNIKSGSH